MKKLSLALTLAPLLPFSACGGDPVGKDAASYYNQMTPALEQNMALAQQFLEIAALVRKEELQGDKLVKLWKSDIMPTADELLADAKAIEPATPQLSELHLALIDAWDDRARSYHDMYSAWEKSDTTAFARAQQANVQAKLAEERYFQDVNALLDPYGYHLDQFPQSE